MFINTFVVILHFQFIMGQVILSPPHPTHMVKSQPPVPQNMTEFGDWAFKGVIKLKLGC